MSSGLLEPLRRNIGVRLSLWYALIFTATGLALLTLAYYLLAAAIARKDREVLEARLREVAALYEASGVRGIQQWVDNQPPTVGNTLYVQLLDRFNRGVYAPFPGDWLTLRDVPTSLNGVRRIEPVVRIPQNEERDFILGSAALPGGELLRIGRSTDSREALLNPVRHSFVVAGSATVVLGFIAGAFIA